MKKVESAYWVYFIKKFREVIEVIAVIPGRDSVE